MSFTSFKETAEEGDTVILYIGLSQIYALKVQPSIPNRHGVLVEYTFQTKYGALRVMDLVGKKFGSKISLTKGYAYILYPSPELWTLTLPHRTQILYTPDISMVITEMDIKCGSVVCEAGTGSGSLSHAILRAIGPTGHLYSSDFHQERVEAARREFENHGYGSRVTVKRQDVCSTGFEVKEVADAVFLDLPKPWEALPHAVISVKKTGGRICTFSPCVEQVNKTCECMRKFGLTDINTIENLQREFQLRTMSLPTVAVKMLPFEDLYQLKKEKTVCNSTHKKQKTETNEDEEQSVNLTEPKEDTEENVSPLEEAPESQNSEGIRPRSEISLNLASSTVLESMSSNNNNSEVKFRTGIPLLKMPGHTGYLTFATVPPNLDRKVALSCLINKTS